MPSAFSITFDVLPSITATHEFVVPRSIPMTFPMVYILLFAAGWPGPDGAPIQTPRYQMFAMTRDAVPHIGGGVWPARTGRGLAVGKRGVLELRRSRSAIRRAIRIYRPAAGRNEGTFALQTVSGGIGR